MKSPRIIGIIGSGLAALVLGVTVASAHVTVNPNESAAGGFERYAVRVPTEKPVPTVKLELEIPANVTFSKVAPKPGWKYELKKDAAGKVTGIVWSGGSIAADEFDEFYFQARNPKDPGKIAWKAYQTYGDGSVVEWVEPEGSSRPASITNIKAAIAASAADDDHGVAVRPAGGDASAVPAATTSNNGLPMGLLAASGGVALLALGLSIVALRRS